MTLIIPSSIDDQVSERNGQKEGCRFIVRTTRFAKRKVQGIIGIVFPILFVSQL